MVGRAIMFLALLLLAGESLAAARGPRLELERRACDVKPEFLEDGFCDCPRVLSSDRPDELKTGACGVGVFECSNVASGFVPTPLPWSMVGDGICDCCDGSDETPEVLCPQRCPEEAQKSLERLQERLATHAEAEKHRKSLIRRVFQVQPKFWEQLADEAADLEAARHQGIEMQQRLKQLGEELRQGSQTGTSVDPEMEAEFHSLSELSQQHRMEFRKRALRWHGLVLVVGQPSEQWLQQREQGTHRRIGLVPDLRQASLESLNHLAFAGLLGNCFNGLYSTSRYDAKWDLLADHYVVRVCPLGDVTQITISAAHYAELKARADDPESWKFPEDTPRFHLGSWDGWAEAGRIAERRMRWLEARQAEEGSDLEIPNEIQPTFDMQLVTRARYTGGDPCWQAPPRRTTLEYVCGNRTRVASIREDGSCDFVVELETPAMCLPQFREELQRELDLLQDVIAGKNPFAQQPEASGDGGSEALGNDIVAQPAEPPKPRQTSTKTEL